MRKLVVYLGISVVFFGLVEFLPRAEDSAYRENVVLSKAFAEVPPSATPNKTTTPEPKCCSRDGAVCDPNGLCASPSTTSTSCSSSSSSTSGYQTSRARASKSNQKKAVKKKGKRSTAAYLRLSERTANRNRYSTLRSIKKKKKNCADGCDLAPGCTVLKGSQEDAEWMQCYIDAGGPLHELCCNTCDVIMDCWLSEEDEQDIIDKCKDLPTEQDKINCVYAGVKAGLDEGSVCRHYAECVEDILGSLGFDTNFEVGCTGIFNCHAWVEVTDENGCTVYVDSYNGIMYKCCPPAVE